MATDRNSAQIWLCSSNPGKLRDFELAARASGVTALAIKPLSGLDDIQAPDENGNSFEENATSKSLYYSAFTKEPVLADDSGLEVEALDGAPGVHSARYAGTFATDDENNRLLLSNLENMAKRDARFVCVLALARQGSVLLTVTASVCGRIMAAAKGSGGFGYDPIFFYPPLQRSFGELQPEEKLAVSHRGKAFRELVRQLPDLLSIGS